MLFSTPYILELLFGIVFRRMGRSAVHSVRYLPTFRKKRMLLCAWWLW